MMLAAMEQAAMPVSSTPVASPKLLNEFITEADLPRGWIKHDKWHGGAVYFTYLRMFVSDTGRPVRCEVATTAGLPKKFDPCAFALSRAQFQAASDQDGKPVDGVTYVWFFWKDKKWLGSKYDYVFPSDFSFSVNKLSPPAPFGAYVRLNVLSDKSGHVEACSPDPSVDAIRLGHLACAQLTQTTMLPAKDARGIPMRAVQSTVVTFYQSSRSKNKPTR